MYKNFQSESLKARVHLEDPGKKESNIKINLEYVIWECVDWAQQPEVMARRIP
jgi:hypothetical protein